MAYLNQSELADPIQYISDTQGKVVAVIIPIELWQQIQMTPPLLQSTETRNAWEILETLTGTLTAPTDWAEQHQHYLYGTPKQNDVALSP
jgi:hypothetical protein